MTGRYPGFFTSFKVYKGMAGDVISVLWQDLEQ